VAGRHPLTIRHPFVCGRSSPTDHSASLRLWQVATSRLLDASDYGTPRGAGRDEQHPASRRGDEELLFDSRSAMSAKGGNFGFTGQGRMADR
jgi:hypothetical protein